MTTNHSPSLTSLLDLCRQSFIRAKLSLTSRKLYLSDIKRFLVWFESSKSLTPSNLANPALYRQYLEKIASTHSPSLVKRTTASLKQLGAVIAATYSLPNPLQVAPSHQPSAISHKPSFNYLKYFTNYLKQQQLSKGTIKSYKSDIGQYLQWAATNHPGSNNSQVITNSNIQKYLNHLSKSQLYPTSTRSRKQAALTRFRLWYESAYPTSQQPRSSGDIKLSPFFSPSLEEDTSTPKSFHQELITARASSPHSVLYSLFSIQGLHPRVNSLVNLGLMLLLVSALAIFGYRAFSRDQVLLTQAYPTTPVTPNRQLSFQGRLEDSAGTPITSSTNLVFKLWNDPSVGTELYSTGTCAITPDSDGVFSTQIGSTCGSGIASSVFTENSDIYLEVTVASETLTPRQQIATVAYALNAETIQGVPLSSTMSAIANTIVPMTSGGEIIIGEQSPKMRGVSGTFNISAPALSLTTATGSSGNISLAPDGTGQVNVTGNTTGTNFFNVSNAQLTTGSLITGTAGNANTGFKLLDLLSGSSPTSKFSVDATGLTTIGADLYVSSGLSTFGTAVSDGTIEATKFCTGDDETNCVTDFAGLTAGANIWTNSTTTDYLTSTGNDLVIGGSSPLSGAKVSIDGDADQIQLVVQGVAGQTANLQEWQNSSGTVLGGISSSGTGGFGAAPDTNIGVKGYKTATTTGSAGGTFQLVSGSAGYASLAGIRSTYSAYTANAQTGTNAPSAINVFVQSAFTFTTAEVSGITSSLTLANVGTPTVTKWNGLLVNTPTIDAGTLANANGLYIYDITGATTTNYAIYTNAGDVRFGDDVETTGTLTLPNTSVLTGDTAYLRSSRGLAFGANETYYINSSGTGNLNALTLAGTLDANGQVDLGDGGESITINGSSVSIQSTGAGSDITLDAVDQIILTDFTNTGAGCTALETNGSGHLVCGTDNDSGGLWADGTGYLYPTAGEVLGNPASAGSNKLSGLYLADSAPLVFGTDNNVTYAFDNTGSVLNVTLGSNDINFDANTLFIDGSADRVGIGTNTPSATLDVQGTATVSGILSVGNGTANTIRSPYGPLSLQAKTGADTWTNSLTIDDLTGYVGIGTDTPGYLLDVAGDARFQGTTFTDQVNFAGATTYYVDINGNAKFLDLVVADTGNPGLTVGNGTIGFVKIGGSTISDNNGNLTLDSDTAAVVIADDLTISGGNITNAITFDSAVTLASTLTLPNSNTLTGVANYVRLSNGLSVGGADTYYLNSSGSLNANAGTFAGAFTANGTMAFGNGSGDTVAINSGAWTFATDTNFVLSGGVNGLSFDTDTLSIDATNKRVGIGTTSPGAKLEINAGTLDGLKISTQNLTQQLFRMGYNGNTRVGASIVSDSGVFTLYNSSGTSIVNLKADGDSHFSGGAVSVGTATPDSQATFQVSRSTTGFAAIFEGNSTAARFRNQTSPRYRSDFFIDSSGLAQNAYDDTAASYIPIKYEGSTLSFNTGTTSVSNAMYIDSSGNVGIGLTPIRKLDIQQTTDAVTGGIGIQNSGQTKRLNLWTDSSGIGRIDTGDGSSNLVLNASGGKVAIGNTSSSGYSLDVQYGIATWAARIFNDGNLATYRGLVIQVGTDDNSGTNYHLGFLDGDGTAQGYVTSSGGTVSYGAFTANHDTSIPEHYNASGYPYGTLLCIVGSATSDSQLIRKIEYQSKACDSGPYSPSVLGAYSTKYDDEPNLHQVYVLGDGHILVNSENGDIKMGDAITTSSTTGVGMKATGSGHTIGYAQQDYHFSSPSEVELIAVQYGLGYHIPQFALNESGEATLNGSTIADYSVTTTDGIASNIGAFAKVVVAKIEAGFVQTRELVTDRLTVTEGLISPQLATNTITPVTPQTSVTVQADLEVTGKLEADTISAREAKFQEITTHRLYADEVIAGSITAGSIEGLDAKLASLSAGSTKELTDSELDTITDRIKSRLAEISGTSPTAEELPVPESEPVAALPAPDYELDTIIASDSATLASLDADMVIINHYLAVIGSATITNLDVTGYFYTDTISSKSGILALQPQGSINLGSGTLLVDSSGQVAVNGDLTVSGQLLASKATLGSLSLGSSPEASGNSALGQLLAVYNEQGQAVATIDSSGSANLRQLSTNLITIASSSEASQSASSTLAQSLATATQSNATAGEAILISPNTELTIESPYVTPNTLVYLTPTGNTDNKVLFVKSKSTCQQGSEPCTPSFTVGVDSPASTDITFNWWIIELKQ